MMARLRGRDPAAFEELVRRHGGAMLAVARRLLRNEDDARDAVQDAFVSVLRAVDGFRGDAQLSTWLHRIAVNAALMRLRQRPRQTERTIDPLLPQFLEDGHQMQPARAWGQSAEEVLDREETRRTVRQMIDELPESYRIVLQLRDIEELSTAETAALLQMSESAVKVRLHRARQALRTRLDQLFSTGAL